MNKAKFLLPSGAAVLVLLGSPSVAMDAVLAVRGCGTGCRVETVQLSKPARMPGWAEMPGGWGKVLVKETWIWNDWNGVDHVLKGYQYWFFANCREGLAAFGKKSDRSDATIGSIYTESGYPKNTSVAGNIYDRYQKLCNALR